MKNSIILRILATAFVVSWLAVLIPSTPALAQPEIALSPSSGSVGTKVTVTGTEFQSFKGTEVSIFFDDVEIDNSPLTVPQSGTFTTDFDVPDDAEPGIAYVKVRTLLGGEAKKSFIVQGPEIELSADEGAVGTMVTVEGQGFYAGGEVDLYYYKDGTRVNVATETASPSGEFTYTGTGFGGERDVTIYFNNIVVARDTANKYGSFEVAFDVPTTASGTYDIEAEDDEDNTDKAEFTVAVGASLSESTGVVGTLLIVSGVGFMAGTSVTITYDDLDVATAISGDNGAFSAAFNVPASVGGNHTITITDGTNTATCIFTMESEAPPTPVLLLPEDNTKAEAETHFDWEDITDPSGVTYTLQVATKDNFAASYIVLEKTGLTDSEYAVIEGEELEPSSKEAPHYWRVKAVDGASNESEWSAVRSFYVGSSFTLPNTVRNVLIGLGVAGAGFFGFWLGRRTAYSRRI